MSSWWPHHGEKLLLLGLMLVVFAARLWQLPAYPFHEDEIGSIGVMRSIVETGLPLTGGSLYWRAPLAHYLMALPLLFGDVSPVTARLTNVVLSLFLLPVGYGVGRQLQGRTAGWLAALLLGFSAYQNLLAAFTRWYQPLQLFFLLSIYLAARYWLEGKRKGLAWPLGLAVVATLLCDKPGLFILPAVAWAWLLAGDWGLVRRWRFLLAVLVVLMVAWLADVWTPAGTYRNTFALNLALGGLKDKWAFARWFRDLLPLGWTLLLLAVAPLVMEGRRWWYYGGIFVLGLVGTSLLAPGDNPRYMAHIFPVGLILAASAAAWWLQAVRSLLLRHALPGRGRLAATGALLLASVVFFVGVDKHDVSAAVGYYFKFVDQKPAHDYLASRLQPQDRVISVDPGITDFYLGCPVNYFLRQKFDPVSNRWSPYPAGVRSDYNIDSPERLREVLDQAPGRVWLYANWKMAWAVDPELDRLVREWFRPVFAQGETWVLVSNPGALRRLGRPVSP
ncbi:hypothetical protein JCM30471_15620 [Desulfuromonas carbonis]|uniref:ArnT family glycosyltransferase n=1 Tax=Desulfuromonas sp. DDH964 TaxID=1823759 RepID=UPI00078D5429|nr:glycosyltransferase family 39 protein [Desulfuromonas sp. DDH964]AMV73153.1 hypothetical protein DBW_2843 [Desulfuromonas sp. DDH964]